MRHPGTYCRIDKRRNAAGIDCTCRTESRRKFSAGLYVSDDLGNDYLGDLFKACHVLEIPFVFDNVDDIAITGGRPDKYQLRDSISDAWISFARTETESQGNSKWEPYSAQKRSTMLLDVPCRVEVDPFRKSLTPGQGYRCGGRSSHWEFKRVNPTRSVLPIPINRENVSRMRRFPPNLQIATSSNRTSSRWQVRRTGLNVRDVQLLKYARFVLYRGRRFLQPPDTFDCLRLAQHVWAAIHRTAPTERWHQEKKGENIRNGGLLTCVAPLAFAGAWGLRVSQTPELSCRSYWNLKFQAPKTNFQTNFIFQVPTLVSVFKRLQYSYASNRHPRVLTRGDGFWRHVLLLRHGTLHPKVLHEFCSQNRRRLSQSGDRHVVRIW